MIQQENRLSRINNFYSSINVCKICLKYYERNVQKNIGMLTYHNLVTMLPLILSNSADSNSKFKVSTCRKAMLIGLFLIGDTEKDGLQITHFGIESTINTQFQLTVTLSIT